LGKVVWIRLLIELKALNSFSRYALEPHKMQGFVYKQLLGTSFEDLHDKTGYKFFCFSNIFMPNHDRQKREFTLQITQGENCNWIIASPDELLIQTLTQKILQKKQDNQSISIGETQFAPVSIKPVKTKLNENTTLKTATPIILRVPQIMYANYGLESNLPYLYWRPEMDFNAFIKQLEENLFKKYNEYNNTTLEKFPLFETFHFKKTTTNQLIEEEKSTPLHGSIWEFQFSAFTPTQKKILEFGIDCGFGERNTLGFGFINAIK
jgi:CRISPR-associated endoribonuclease Cas6